MVFPHRRILLVEDHQDTRELFALLLGQRGYAVETATSLSEATELIKTKAFNLFMFDSSLPDGSGVDLCRRVRQFDQATPIVFCSAHAYEADKRSAIEAGAQAYVVKPIDLGALMRSIEELLKRAESRDGESQLVGVNRPL
jgi:DNA-binding response OmpR family regulator